MNRYTLDPDGLDGVFNPEINTNNAAQPNQNADTEAENLNFASQITDQNKAVSSNRLTKLGFLAAIVASTLISLVVLFPFGKQKSTLPHQEESPTNSPVIAENDLDVEQENLLSNKNDPKQNLSTKSRDQKIAPSSETTGYEQKVIALENLSTRNTDGNKVQEATTELIALEKKVEANITKNVVNKPDPETFPNKSSNTQYQDKFIKENFSSEESSSKDQSAITKSAIVDIPRKNEISKTNMSTVLVYSGKDTADTTKQMLLQFDFDTTNLSELQQSKKADLIAFAQKCKNNIIVTGHTCNIGSSEINFAVGLARAEATKIFLSQEGIPSKKITIKSLGEKQPVASNDTFEGRQQNRFVTIQCSVN